MTTSSFPKRLLTASSQERYAYFHGWHVMHPKLLEARDALLQAIQYDGHNRVIHLFGCTGVGKTTLRLWLEKLLMEAAQAEMRANPDYVPVASVVTPAPDQGPFNWRDVYVQTLHVLNEPSMLIRSRNRPQSLQFVPEAKLRIAPKMPRAELRLAMVGSLYQRGVKVLFYDDAQHLQMVTKAQRLQDQMENLKWLSDVSETTIVLVGTYDVLNLIDLSGQLARRSTTIHFARYHAEDSVEFQQFANVVYAFQQHMPLKEPPKLVEHCDYLYERTLGCVGLLKGWLERVLVRLLADGSDSCITEELLKSCTDVRKLVAVAKEAVAGEQRVYATEGLQAELQGLLQTAARIPQPSKQIARPISTRQNKHRPGERRAKRDKVGKRDRNG
ncbi:MAG: ATP-binding protein [Anaerolineae bacterium]|nr:ATP-binding protein [Anaerolineae bacterium]MCO5193072.1 ATP-binding protein [Anaerolineae bacterium]MCO5206198.1 ATP-binding protein [Anaerolineae bacterium]